MGKSKKNGRPDNKKALLESDSSDSEDSDSTASSSSSADEKVPSNSKNKAVSFSINQKYAKDYQSRKLKEELAREREKHGSDNDDDDSSSSSTSESEDEDADLLTTKLNVDILKTINALRTKDESIYDSNVRFFPASDEDSDDEGGSDTGNKPEKEKKKSKPKRVKDVLREQILEQMQQEEEEEEEEGEKSPKKNNDKTDRLAYDEQQKELRKAFLDSKQSDDSDDADDGDDDESDKDDFLVIKKRDASSQEEDAHDKQARQQYDKELRALEDSVLQHQNDDNSKQHRLVDPRGEVQDGEKFLLDFIKNKTWIDKTDRDVDSGDSSGDDDNNKNDSDDESLEQLEQADDFEAKYNFRFEEAALQASSGADFSVRGYARSQTMNTLRRKDETRRDKRLARQERKAAERKAKEEKLRRLKNAKRLEMEQKMKQVKAVLGAAASNSNNSNSKNDENDNPSDALTMGDDGPIDEAAIMKLLEGDYDPEKFEKSMQEAFGDDFYDKEDSEWKTDADVRKALKQDGEVDYTNYDDEEEQMDMDDDHNNDVGIAYNDEGQDAAGYEEHEDDHYDADNDDQEEAETELEKKVRAKMEDKLYELDYEDIVAGMPTRFKYKKVEPNNYGLTTEEILLARDQTLNQFVSLKKLAPYRESGEYHVSSRKRRKFREQLDQDIEEAEQKLKEQGITVNDNHEEPGASDNNSGLPKKKRRRRMKKGGGDSSNKQPKPKGKSVDESAGDDDNQPSVALPADQTTEGKKGKRRRKKKGKKVSNAAKSEQIRGENIAEKAEINTKPSASTSLNNPPTAASTVTTPSPTDAKKARKKKKKKDKKKKGVEGVSAARLASYGL